MTGDSFLNRGGLFTALLLFCLAVCAPPVGAAPGAPFVFDGREKLTEFDYLLLGLSLRPDPEVQIVPRNTATGIRVALEFSQTAADAEGLLSLLPGTQVAAELIGPGLPSPVSLRAAPGELLTIPPLVSRGLYMVRDLRLEREVEGVFETFLRASPDTATIEVIDQILITQVTTRPLTLEEIRQKGILFGEDDFKGFEFTLAMKLDSKPVNVNFSALFDQNNVPIPTRNGASIHLEGPGAPVINTSMVPIMLTPQVTPEQQEMILAGFGGNISIPGLLVIPGDVGFLDQFFSAILLVSNGAPEGSGLSVSDLNAAIVLPPGDDQVPDTEDDPLEIAETESGRFWELPVLGVGPDQVAGTSDDTDRFQPGEQGQAEFLLQGKGEGFHAISFDIEGMLEGLPIGPVPVRGTAQGGVLVRQPYFNMTFSAPATVRKGEEFTLFATVTNISQAIANAVQVSLNQASLSGATLLGEPSHQIDTLLPGDSEVIRWSFRSDQTGQVTASYLHFEGSPDTEGELRFHLGVNEQGVPLSPDTIVLPAVVEALPEAVVESALRVLGQAWSVATAPSGTLPEGVTRISKTVVLDRAGELAEAAFRHQLGEDLDEALLSLAFSWVAISVPGFEQILRETNAGAQFLEALGSSLTSPGTVPEYQQEASQAMSSLSPHLLIGVGSGLGEAPVEWQIEDHLGRRLQSAGTSDLPHAGLIPLAGSGRALALVGSLESNLYEMRFVGTDTGEPDLGISLPFLDSSTGLYVFPGVAVNAGDQGKVVIDLRRTLQTLSLYMDRNSDGVFEETIGSAPVEIIIQAGPSLLAATAIGPETLSGADPWGRVVALLFDREMREAEANLASNFRVEANQVLSSRLQLSGRLVFLFLRDPVGDFIPRTVDLSGLYDTSGLPMGVVSTVITSLLADPGAIVSGRVLRADGSPLTGAQVLYRNTASVRVGRIGISQKEVSPDGTYSFDYVRQAPDGPFSIRAIEPGTNGIQELVTSVRVDGEHIVVDLVLRGRGGVTGIVKDLADQPVPGANVLVTSQVDPANFSLAETDGAGRYSATGLLVGPVSVQAVLGTASGTAAGNIQRAGTFATIDVALNSGAGRVSGGIYDGDAENPLPQMEVYYLIPHPTSLGEIVVASSESASDGSYLFDGVPSGEFRILALDRVTGRQASRSGTMVGGGLLEGFDVIFSAVTEEVFGTIQGLILDGAGEGVEGALVQGAGRQVTTDASGNFVLDRVPEGWQTVLAIEPGTNRTASRRLEVTAGNVVSVTLAFPGSGQVSVTVLGPVGEPLAGQQVIQVSGTPCGGVEQVTDGSGVALFEGVTIPGATFKATRGNDLAVAYATVQHHGEAVALTLQFSGFGTVSGTVLDPDNQQVLGADVVLGAGRLDRATCSFLWEPTARYVKTGADGKFVFDNVPVGSISVSASSFFFPVPTTAKDVLLADGDARDFTLTLSSHFAGEVSGTVFLPDGETPAGSGVSVTVTGGSRPDVTVTTDASGHFQFAKIFPEGRYVLSASDVVTGAIAQQRIVYLLEEQDLVTDLRLLGRGTVVVTVLDGAGVEADEAFVELRGTQFPHDEAAGAITPLDEGTIRFERITEGDFTVTAQDRLGRGGRASGTVTGEGAEALITVSLTVTGTVQGVFLTSNGEEPIPNAEVRLRQGITGRLLGSTTTSSQPDQLGRFEFTHVPAGTLLATAGNPLTGRIGEASGQIEAEGEVIEIEILELGLGKISGRVVSGGNPMPGAVVEITSQTGLSGTVNNFEATSTSGAQGEFVFDGVPVGKFTLKATVPGLLLTGTVSGNLETDGQEIDDIEIELAPSGTIRGTVYRPDGVETVPGAKVTLKLPRATLRTDTNASGDFRFEFVPVGDFALRAEESGGPDAGLASGTLGEGEELEIDIVFNGTGTVEGIALDSDGSPLSFGLVRLTTPEPFPRSETTTVAGDGSFRFLRILVGELNLSLSVEGSVLRGVASGTIQEHQETVQIDIQLADAGTVLGIVLRMDEVTPAANAFVTVTGNGFRLTDLTDDSGAFRIEGIPLGDFTALVEDSLTEGLAVVSNSVSFNGEEVDLGELVLDDSPIAVESINPPAGATLVPPDSPIVIRFTDPLEPASVPGAVQVRSQGSDVPVDYQVSPDGLELTLEPIVLYPPQQPWFQPQSEVEIRLSQGLADTAGRNLEAELVSTFTTGGAVVTGSVFDRGVPVVGAEMTLVAGLDTQVSSTDDFGKYRFQNVPVGNALIQAQDSGTGFAGSTVVVVGPTDGVVTADIAIAYAGNITGQVLRHDSTPAGAGLEVVIFHGDDPVSFTTTDANGQYLITTVPLGDFTVDVTDPTNGDRGRGVGSLTQAGQTVTVEVQMIGVGSVRLDVRDTAGDPVTTAETAIQFSVFGWSNELRNSTPEPDGTFLYPFVLAGPFTAEAVDPATGLNAFGSGTVVADTEVSLELVLQPSGAIVGTVLAPDGETPVAGAEVKLYRESDGYPIESRFSDAAGSFRFDDVPAGQGTYRIDVFVNRVRARRRAIVVPTNGEVEVELVLVGLGSVTGQVLPPAGQTLSPSARVELSSSSPDLGGFFTDWDVSDGTYLIEGVPVGPFKLTGRDTVKGFLGEAEGSLSADGETVNLDIQLLDNAINLSYPKRLKDANDLTYTVSKSGSLSESIFNNTTNPGAAHLEVTVEGVTTAFEGEDIGSQEEGGREIATHAQDMGGLLVQRKVFVPEDGYFARYLEIFENSTVDPVTLTATVVSSINQSPRVRSTSSGDEIPDIDDDWIAIDDNTNSDPFESPSNLATSVWMPAGGGGASRPVSMELEENVGGASRLTVRYELTVPPAQRVLLMHFVVQQLTVEAGEEAGYRLSSLAPESLIGLSIDEADGVVNFDVPAGGTSQLAPLPGLDGFVAGRLFAHDGERPLGSEQSGFNVRFQSDHILFRRIRPTVSDSSGRFTFKDITVPRTDYTLDASPGSSLLRNATADAAGDFVGQSFLSRSPDKELAASSVRNDSTVPSNAFDGVSWTYWMSESGDTANGGSTPTLEMALPVPVEVERVYVDTRVSSSLEIYRVRVELLGAQGEVLYATEEDLPEPDRNLELVLDPSITGVRRVRLISLSDRGSFVAVNEMEVLGTTVTDIGSALQDLVFVGTSAISGTTRKASGEGVKSQLTYRYGSYTQVQTTDADGNFFFAPIPGNISGLQVTAVVTGNPLLSEVLYPSLTPDVTTPLDISYDPTGMVSGTVLSPVGTPVANKQVTIPYPRSVVFTDANGVYQFPEVPSGNYTLEVYESSRLIQEPITVSAPTPVVQDIQIPAFGSVNVTVLFDTQGGPIMPAPNALVERRDILDTYFDGAWRTNASGQVTLTNVAVGSFTLRITHPTNSSSKTEAQGMVSVPGEVVTLPPVTLSSFGTVTGLVRFADGSPAGVSKVEISGPGIPLRSVYTSNYLTNKGIYTFTRVEAFEPFTIRAYVPGNLDVYSESSGEVPGEGQTASVDVTLPKIGTLEVTVTEEDATPISSAYIYVLDSFNTEYQYKGITNSSGQRTVTLVPDGPFAVRAEKGGRVLGEESGEILEHGEQIEISIVRPAGASVEGTVFGGDSVTPVPDARVELRSEDGSTLWRSAYTDDEGYFLIDDFLQVNETAMVRAFLVGASEKKAETLVTATQPGELLTVTLELPVSVVKGRVVEYDGSTSVPGAQIDLLYEGTFDSGWATANDSGDFAFFNVPPGPFELVAEDDFQLTAYVQAELPESELSLVQDIVLPAFGTIEGAVTDASGSPLSDRWVRLRNANLRGSRTVYPDEGGSFRFERVVLGSFTLTYDHLGDAGRIPASAVGRLQDPSTTVLANLVLPEVGAVFGQLHDSDGLPTVPSDESVRPELEGREVESDSGFYDRYGEINPDGSYLEEEVPVGNIMVTIEDAGEAGTGAGTVVAGAGTEINVVLGTAVAVPVPIEPLVAPNGFLGIRGNGSVDGEDSSEGFSLSAIQINGKSFRNLASATEEPGEIVFGPVRNNGLLHTRRVLVSEDRRFVRHLEILENPNTFDIEATIRVTGSADDSFADVTSSGDDKLDSSDRYFAADIYDLSLGVVFAGAGSVLTPDTIREDNDYEIDWRSLVVPAGGRVILMHFAVQAPDLASVVSLASDLMNLAIPEAFSDLTAQERLQIVNFVVPEP